MFDTVSRHRTPNPVIRPVVRPAAEPRHETVLLVDDLADVAEVTAAMLEQFGYRVIVSTDPAEALAMVTTRNDIDILVSDVVMPGEISGVDLATAALEQAGIRSLLITGFPNQKLADGTFHQFELLMKPFRMDDLARRVRMVIDGR